MSKIIGFIFAVQIFAINAFAEVIKQEHVEVRLISSSSKGPGDQLKVGVHFKIEPHWHIYWKNPGDSGIATKFELIGGAINQILWPYPVRLPLSHLTNFGYENEVVFPIEMTPSQNEMTLSLEWLVCKVECIPGFGKFSFSKTRVPIDETLFQKYLNRVPQSLGSWKTEFVKQDSETFQFKLTPSKIKLNEIKTLFVYPENGNAFKTTLPLIEPKQDSQKESLLVSVPLSTNANSNLKSEAFTFVVHQADGETTSFTSQIQATKKSESWLMGLLLAFLGGIILNLMPCVFPVLFLKAFGFLKETDSKKIRRSSWSYALGVVLTFLIFGGILTALRFSGEAIGWGYQLQNPLVVYGLSLLFFIMALNFYGLFEFGDSLAGKAGQLGTSKFLSGSFGTGVLAVIVASPCTAPFMGTALGLTLLLPPYQSILIFASLGIGMASPMLLLGYVPGLAHRLPRSGVWMVTLKQFLCFPLFATCLWLLWVLLNQRGSEAVFTSLSSFLVITFGIWLLKISKTKFMSALAWIIIAGTGVATVYFVSQISTVNTENKISNWAPFDETIISEKRKTQPVFIDFTASWCITCQVNKRTVLDTEEIQKLFRNHNVYLVRADWTNQDPKITMALEQFKRNSVPLYVFYSNAEEAHTLPELLTKDVIKAAILQEEKK